MQSKRNAYKVLVGKPEGKRPPEITRRMCEGNTEMDPRETEWDDLDSSGSEQGAVAGRAPVNTVINLRFP
jgi:hypothetical protein